MSFPLLKQKINQGKRNSFFSILHEGKKCADDALLTSQGSYRHVDCLAIQTCKLGVIAKPTGYQRNQSQTLKPL